MKVTCCDVCFKNTKTLVKAKCKLSLRNFGTIEVCEPCIPAIKKLSPVEFIKLSYSLDGMEITGAEAKKIYDQKSI